jgi:RNA polymerase sigma-70 factor (ECF subfamily)
VGSAIDGEDIVQETLAKAFYAISLSPEVPELRPWLFRIARNTAIDHLRRYERRNVEALPEGEPMSSEDLGRDPEVLRAALGSFVALPVSQRSAVILKDVLGESLEDIAMHLETTVEAVKALLVRGRQNLRASQEEARARDAKSSSAEHRALVQRYVELFNQRDWGAVQSLLLEEVRLDLVSKSQRQGKAVGMYFGRYEKETGLVFRAVRVEGRDAIGVYGGDPEVLEYVVLLESEQGRVSFIRDFRYVPYLAAALEVERI